MIAKNQKPGWFFYLGWVVLNAITIIMAWYIAWELISLIVKIVGSTIQVGGQIRFTEDFLFFYVLFPIIGLLAGIIQYTLLRRYLPEMIWWIGATILGWLTPFFSGYFIITLLEQRNDTLAIMFGMLLVGAVIAVPQWWMLRKRVRYASWWILAYGFGWCITGLLSLVTPDPFPVLLAIALMPSITTGIICWLLLDRYPKNELKRS